jgi:hypothetical protein
MDKHLEEIINKAASEGAKEALRLYKFKEKKEFNNRRFRNTDILLSNYNRFIDYYDNAKYTIEDVREELNSDNIEFDDMYIKAILSSKVRTAIYIKHIDTAIKRYSIKIKDDKKRTRFNIMKYIYFEDKTYEEAAEKFDCSVDTIRRAKNEMVREISINIFGADGLRMEL